MEHAKTLTELSKKRYGIDEKKKLLPKYNSQIHGSVGQLYLNSDVNNIY